MQLVSRRAVSHGVGLDELPAECAKRGEGCRPVLELLDADVDVPRASRHALLVQMAVNVHADSMRKRSRPSTRTENRDS